MSGRSVPIPFLIQRENVVRYGDGVVEILDRRKYPFERAYVRCHDTEEVAQAIEQMVTQSMGPGPTAGYGMALAARAAAARGHSEDQRAALERAARRLIATRPTNNHIRLVVDETLAAGLASIEAGDDAEEAILTAMERHWADLEETSRVIGQAGAAYVNDGGAVLTHCWADAPFIELLRAALGQGKTFEVFCTETRPYLQGSRLTADAVAELGVRTTVITDSMAPTVMRDRLVDCVFAGADRVTMDGHWFNKVGTLGIALAAQRFGVPVYATSLGPDPSAETAEDVTIEVRNGDEVLSCQGVRTASPRVRGFYPAFDVTPPDLVTAFITPRGVFTPDALRGYPEAAQEHPKEAARD